MHDEAIHVGHAVRFPILQVAIDAREVFVAVLYGEAQQADGIVAVFFVLKHGEEGMVRAVVLGESLDGLDDEGFDDLDVVVPIDADVF